MKYLKELAKAVDKNKTKNIQLIGDVKNENSKLNKLYNGIVNDEFSDDSAACEVLYQSNKVDQRYRNLKSRLEKRLINSVFFIDVNEASYSDYQKAYYSCYKNLAAIKILQGKGIRLASNKLAEKTLKEAIKYHFTEIIISIAKDLRNYYGTLVGDRKKFESYNQLMKEYQMRYKFENDALEMYTTLASYYPHSKSSKPELIERAKRYAEYLEHLLPSVQSLTFTFYAYLVMVLASEIENDYVKTITICDKALESLKKFKNVSNTHIFSFSFKKLYSCIKLRKFEEGEELAQECLDLPEEGSNNWLITLQFYFILLFRVQKFQKIYELFIELNPLKKGEYVPQVLKEFWYVIEAYIHYFVRIGEIDLPNGVEGKPFRIKRFLNEVPVFSKDQRGMKVSILILHLLFLLDQKKYNEVISRAETLQAYVSKYLRKDETYRSNCFIKMLLQIPASNFNPIALERKAAKYYKKLQSHPLEIADQSSEIEIVPYEILWNFILASLRK